MMRVHPSDYYAWKSGSVSLRQKDDQRLLGLIKQSWLESGGVYGYRKIVRDLRDLGESCGKQRVYRLMKQEGLRAQVGYRRRAGHYGKPTVVADNRLEQNVDVEAPNVLRRWCSKLHSTANHLNVDTNSRLIRPGSATLRDDANQ